jgi:lactoylglutathione lyase
MSQLKLGAFSVSLEVKDIHVSKAFYQTLGFTVFGGNIDQKWLIMKNGSTLIGLFQGMFKGNVLTFNPGWDENGQNLAEFDDVRKIQAHLQENKVPLSNQADPSTEGPAFITLKDPDGNEILIDQHR